MIEIEVRLATEIEVRLASETEMETEMMEVALD